VDPVDFKDPATNFKKLIVVFLWLSQKTVIIEDLAILIVYNGLA